MIAKENINLDFLYKRKSLQEQLFNEDSEGLDLQDLEEKEILNKFLKECSLVDVVYLYAKAFKDKYPNIFELNSNLYDSSHIKEKVILRKDIKSVEDLYKQVGELPFMIVLEKLTIQFKNDESISELKEAIFQAFEGKTYNDESSVITVQDSAIKEIRLTEKSFTLLVNEQKAVFY